MELFVRPIFCQWWCKLATHPRARLGCHCCPAIRTWEANSKLAVHLNPKITQSGACNLLGFGISANIKLSPRWELISETNIVANNISHTNGTIAPHWAATEALIADFYATTAASMIDAGTLTSASTKRIETGSCTASNEYLTSLNNSLNRPTIKNFSTIQLKQ